MENGKLKLKLSFGVVVCVTSILTACGGGGSSGSSSGSSSGGGAQTYGSLTVGAVAPLSVKSAVSNYVIPVYNNSDFPVIIGNSISSSITNVSFDIGDCSGKTLNAGEVCYVTASYTGGEGAAGVQHAIGVLSIAKSGSDGRSSTINIGLDYETLPNNYTGIFLAQSLSPVLLRGDSAYTTLWLFNGSNADVPFFNQDSQFSALPTLGSGSWTPISTGCGTTVKSGEGCYVTYKYSTNQQTVKNVLNSNKIKISPPIASVKISANLTGYNIYSDLSVQNLPQLGSSLIYLTPINMSEESYQVSIVNAGNLPITKFMANISGEGFTIDDTSCQAELPLAPGSDICYLNITKNNPEGVASLNVVYSDEEESHTVTAPINYGNLSLLPGSWVITAPQGESVKLNVALINNGSLPLEYAGNTQSGLQDISIDDSGCIGQNVGSCPIIISYSPTSAAESGHGTIVFRAGSQNVTFPISFSSYPGGAADLEFCSDNACNSPIVADNIAAAVGKSASKLTYVKNIGQKSAPNVSLSISPTVNNLSIKSNTCSGSIASGSTCQFVLEFNPTLVESGQTNLTSSYTGGLSTLQVNYSSTESTYANVLYCDDASCTNQISSLNFSAAVQGSQSQTVYVANNGSESATNVTYGFTHSINDITVTQNTCGTSLLNNTQACQITIAFNPQQNESGSLNFATHYTDSTGSKESDLIVNYISSSYPSNTGFLYYTAVFGIESDHVAITAFRDTTPLVLESDNNKYNPLIISSYIGGVLVSYLLDNDPVYPTLKGHYNEDYVIGTVFSQLMQEYGSGVESDFPAVNNNIVSPTSSVMASAQGGPWQINGYLYKQIGPDQSSGLINYVALQKILGYSVDTTSQNATPPIFNNLYYGPIIVAYELEQYFAGQLISTAGAGSTPPVTGACLTNLSSQDPENSPFDVLMKTIYNAGQTSPYSTTIESACTNNTPSEFSESFNTYKAATRLANDSFAWYPFQTRFYNDELYNNVDRSLVLSPAVESSGLNNNHVYFTLGQVAPIFASAFESLGYMTDQYDSATFHYITYATALNAFNQSMSESHFTNRQIIDLGNKSQRFQFYSIVRTAIQNVVSQTNANLLMTTSSDIGVCPGTLGRESIQCFNGYESASYTVGNLVSFPVAVGESKVQDIFQCLQNGWCNQSAYDPRVSGVGYGAWKVYTLDKQCTNPCGSSR